MKIVGTILLSLGVVTGVVMFLLLSSCALDRNTGAAGRTVSSMFALVDAAAVAGGIWAIGRLNRD